MPLTDLPDSIRCYTLDEAAAVLRMSRRTLQRLIAAGHVRPTHILRRVVIRQAEIDRLLDSAPRNDAPLPPVMRPAGDHHPPCESAAAVCADQRERQYPQSPVGVP